MEVVENFLPLENAEHAVEQRRLLVEKRIEANLQVEVLLDAVDVYGAFLEDLEKEGGPFGLIGVEQHVGQQNKHDSNDDQLVLELETDQLSWSFRIVCDEDKGALKVTDDKAWKKCSRLGRALELELLPHNPRNSEEKVLHNRLILTIPA